MKAIAKFFGAALIALVADALPSHAQGASAFTYQGRLRDGGVDANGDYTLIFSLFDAVTGGNRIGGTVTNSHFVTNGVFSVNLDFGPNAFDGNARWLDITVQNGADSETLSPRAQILPAPYALYARTAGGVSGGTVSASNVVASSFQGNGFGLTNLNVEPEIRAFSTNGTFIVPENVTRAAVEIWGGGGGGGGGDYYEYPDVPATMTSGGGGGAGEYLLKTIDLIPLSVIDVIIGHGGGSGQAGGATSFGGLLNAAGGLPGDEGSRFGPGEPGGGGAGGSGNGGIAGAGANAVIAINGVDCCSSWGGNGASATRGGNGGWGSPSGNGLSLNGSQPGGGGGGGGGGSRPLSNYVLQRQTNGISYYYGPGGQGGDGMVIVHFKK
jgi:hypothetical protein